MKHEQIIGKWVRTGLEIFAFVVCQACSHENLTPLKTTALASNYKFVSVKITNACFSPPESFADFFFLMRSVKFRKGEALSIYSRDGVPDEDKLAMGMPIDSDDFSGTGYGNLLVYLLGIPQTSFASIPKCTDPTKTTVPGFLTDCQRNALQLDMAIQSVPRGIPDDIAMWFGMSIRDAQVGIRNSSGDGIKNIQKVKWNAPLGETLDEATRDLLPKYDLVKTVSGSETCYDITVSNVIVMDVANGTLVVPYILYTNSTGALSAKTPPIVIARSIEEGSILEYDYESL